MKQLFTAFFACSAAFVLAQPANDDCAGLINLGVAPACPTQFFSTVNATASDIGFGNNPSCFNGGIAPRDVWFAFTTSDTIVDYSITVTGQANAGDPALRNPQIALYRGDCSFNGLAELLCVSSAPGETILRMDVFGLTPNITYFVRISDYSPTATPNWGAFQICVDQLSPIYTIDEGSSNACFGQLYDSGGPDGDYSNNENHTFTICPQDFHSCITFTLDYYNIEGSTFQSPDQIAFFDGPTADPSTQIAAIGGAGFPSDGGGGGVCYMVQASSGCLTVRFTSDATVVAEGFAGSWECSTVPCEPAQPITVQGNITEDDILNSITSLQTLVTVTNVNCPQRAYGVFQAPDNSDLGLEKGLLLTTGDLNWAIGPNNNGGGGNANANNNAPGDPDLDYLSITFGDGSLSRDACIIELDVTAFTNEITFEYIFGSEEYPEFVNDFNDIFAFLISGPGITGDPNIGNQLNIAVLPDGSNTIVEINNVNHLLNWQYYRNNEIGQSTQYDGLTSDLLGVKKSLTARASVTPCSTYHLKIAIADRLDNLWDSGVFISEIRGGTPRLAVEFNSGIDYLIESCTTQPDNLIIQLSNVLDEEVSYNVVISGTAIRGVDYTLDIPGVITFAPGQTQLSFPIFPLSDDLVEGIETIVISLTNDFGCGEVVYTTITIELHDELAVSITPGQDTAFVCQGGSALLNVEGAATYFWTPVSIMSDPLSSSPVATPLMDTWVTVQGTAGVCTAIDSIFLKIIDPQISISALDPVTICQGESVRLSVTDNANNTNLIWTPATGLDDAQSPSPVATPEVTTTYIATIQLFECTASDSITIDVNQFEFPQIGNDTLICQNYSVQLAETINAQSTLYSWTPAAGLDDPTRSGPVATPEVTTTYTLIATSENGACSDTAQITITVVPADVDIQQPDTLEICIGTVVPLVAVTSTGSDQGLLWSTNLPGSLSDTIGLSVTATPSQSASYYARFEIGACLVFDSVFVRVDSLPTFALMADPEKDPYCNGDIVVLTSQIYEPGDFPDIRFEWLPGPGYETADTLWNMVLIATDTFTYQRLLINRGCRDTASITLNVITPPTITVTPADTSICPGQSVQLLAEGYEDYTFSWNPEDGLSCTDCPDPIATPASTTTYNFQADVPNCPAGASATIRVVPPPVVDPAPSQTICLGEAVQLNFAADSVSVYTWTSSTDPNFISNDPLLTVAPLVTTTYSLTAARAGCPEVLVSITITVVQPPTASAGADQTICEGSAVNLAGIIGGGATAGMWAASEAGTFNPGDNTLDATFTPAAPGQVIMTLRATTPGDVCPAASNSFTLFVNRKAEVDAGPDQAICAGDAVLLQGSIDGAATSAVWIASVPGGVFNPNANTLNAFYTPPAGATSVTLTLRTDDPEGPCPAAEDEMVISITPRATVNAGPDITLCRNELPVELDAVVSPSTVEGTYRWFRPGTTETISTMSTVSIGANLLGDVTPIVVAFTYGPGGLCGTVTDTVLITVRDTIPITGLEVDPATVVIGSEVTVTVSTDPEDPAGATYQWSVDGGTPVPGQAVFTNTPIPATDLVVTYAVTITSADGCVSRAFINVNVIRPDILFPNVFTPNGDGVNDIFRPIPMEVLGVLIIEEFKVYNRWGQVVYDGPSNGFEGWDGTHNGKLAPSDVYVYRVKFRYPDTPVLEASGDITLLR